MGVGSAALAQGGCWLHALHAAFSSRRHHCLCRQAAALQTSLTERKKAGRDYQVRLNPSQGRQGPEVLL